MCMFRLIRMCAMTHGLMDWCPQDVPDDVTVYTHLYILHTHLYVCECFILHMYVRHDSWTRGLVAPRRAWRCHCIRTHTAFVYVYIYFVMYIYICWLWCHDSFICVPWLIRMCGMTHSYVCHDSLVRVPWQQAKAKCVLQDLAGRKFCAAPRLIYTRAMTYSYVRHDSFVRVPWLIRTCAMTENRRKRSARYKTWRDANSALCYAAWHSPWRTRNWLMPSVDLRCVSLRAYLCLFV